MSEIEIDSELHGLALRHARIGQEVTVCGRVSRDGWLWARPRDRQRWPARRPRPHRHSEGWEARHHGPPYRDMLVTAPRAPIKTLAEHLGVSEATVRRWVQRARDQGFLGESRPGKAGETPRRRKGTKRAS